MWDSNPRMPEPQSGVLTKLHQYRHHSNNNYSIPVNTVAQFFELFCRRRVFVGFRVAFEQFKGFLIFVDGL